MGSKQIVNLEINWGLNRKKDWKWKSIWLKNKELKYEGLIWEKQKNQRACFNLIGDEIENKLRKKRWELTKIRKLKAQEPKSKRHKSERTGLKLVWLN